MHDVLRYSGWEPNKNPIIDQSLLEACQLRAKLLPNYKKALISGCLTPKRHELLYYVANGLENKEIAEHKKKTAGTRSTANSIGNALHPLFLTLDATNRLEASLKGVAIGALAFTDLIKPGEQDLLRSLTGRQREVLEAMTSNYGVQSSNEQIGKKLYIEEGTVGIHIGNIMRVTEIHSRTRLGVISFSLDH